MSPVRHSECSRTSGGGRRCCPITSATCSRRSSAERKATISASSPHATGRRARAAMAKAGVSFQWPGRRLKRLRLAAGSGSTRKAGSTPRQPRQFHRRAAASARIHRLGQERALHREAQVERRIGHRARQRQVERLGAPDQHRRFGHAPPRAGWQASASRRARRKSACAAPCAPRKAGLRRQQREGPVHAPASRGAAHRSPAQRAAGRRWSQRELRDQRHVVARLLPAPRFLDEAVAERLRGKIGRGPHMIEPPPRSFSCQ
jgi:hypothetical protein